MGWAVGGLRPGWAEPALGYDLGYGLGYGLGCQRGQVVAAGRIWGSGAMILAGRRGRGQSCGLCSHYSHEWEVELPQSSNVYFPGKNLN